MTARSHKVSTTLDNDSYERLKYWASRRNLTVAEYLQDSIETMIALENHDYDLPDAEIQRLNQLVEAEAELALRIDSLEHVVNATMRSLVDLARGDEYLTNRGVMPDGKPAQR